MTTIFGEGGGTLGLLSLGKRFSPKGIGLTQHSRQRMANFQSATMTGLNNLLSTSVGGTNQIEIAQKQILAARAKLSDRDLAPSLRGTTVDKKA